MEVGAERPLDPRLDVPGGCSARLVLWAVPRRSPRVDLGAERSLDPRLDTPGGKPLWTVVLQLVLVLLLLVLLPVHAPGIDVRGGLALPSYSMA